MHLFTRLVVVALLAVIPLACTTVDTAQTQNTDSPGGAAYPEKVDANGNVIRIGPDKRSRNLATSPRAGEKIFADGPVVVSMSNVRQTQRPDWVTDLIGPANKRNHAPGPISESAMAALRDQAKNLPANARAPQVGEASVGDPVLGAPTSLTGFEGPDSGDCCGGTTVTVPPDPEMAAGKNHVIAAINSAFAIYSKSGAVAEPPRTFENLFSGFPECQGTFDPNVLYDEAQDRYFMGIVGNGSGTHYCIAVSQTGDPTGNWNLYSLQVDIGGNFFDYPHAGIGTDAIYFSANMFGASYEESIIWAIDKAAMYSGNSSPQAVSQSIGLDFTAQPMNIHGLPFPASGGAHYFIANDIKSDGTWNADDFVVYSWANALNGGTATIHDTFSLSSSPAAGFPVDQPQSGPKRGGGPAILDGGDWRIQDAEYSSPNNFISMTQAVSCNPGGGTVNCVRWAQVSPNSNGVTVDDVGVIASSGQYRSYPDSAINSCGDIAIGYSKTSSSTFPGVWAAAREGAAGTPVSSEVELKAGETTYTSFQSRRQANRWGDYTGMTIDPDGETFWYLGEYAKDSGLSTNWATYVSSFKLDSCSGGPGNTAPSANISAPADSSSTDEGQSISFSGSASDAEDGDLSASLSWTSNLDGSIGSGGAFSNAGLSVGTHTVTASVTDSGGLSATDSISIVVNSTGGGNTAPTVVISTPAEGSSTDEGQSISFNGSASDAEDGDLTASLFWTSNLDGSIGNGGAFNNSDLSVGTHTITASVTDSGSLSGADNVSVTVNSTGGGNTMSVAALTGGSASAPRNRWSATATVTVSDGNGAPLAGVTVDGSWSNGTNGGGSCVTTTGGSCSITKTNIKGNRSSVLFSVDALSLTGYTYDAGSNTANSVSIAR